MMALHFILETQVENASTLPLMSCGDVRIDAWQYVKKQAG